jgi:hypothetical protein
LGKADEPLGLADGTLGQELIDRMERMELYYDHHRKMTLGPIGGALEQELVGERPLGLIDRIEPLGLADATLVQELIGMTVLGLVDGTGPLKEHDHLMILRTQLGLLDLRHKRPLEQVDGVQQGPVDGVQQGPDGEVP